MMLKGGDFARKTVELPRRLKRLISVCTDCLMIPLALWTAISLKIGQAESNLSDWPAFLLVIAVSWATRPFSLWPCPWQSAPWW
jgi:hypothetical protein